MMLTEIAPRSAPESKGPTTPLDRAILDVLYWASQKGDDLEPRVIFNRLGEDNCSLQQVHARLRVLVNRNVVVRVVPENAPRRGPGAGRYQLA